MDFSLFSISAFKKFFLVLLLVTVVPLLLVQNLLTNYHQQFSLLAQSFLSGKTYLLQLAPYTDNIDTVTQNGRTYFILSPFPAIALIPLVAVASSFGLFFFQGYLNILVLIGIFFVSYKLSQIFKFSRIDSLYLACALCFGSTFYGVAANPMSWYFSHSVSVLLLLFALYEYYTHKRFLIIGLLLSMILATRATSAVAILFFTAEVLLMQNRSYKQKIVLLLQLFVPVLISFMLLAQYNFVRFGNYWDNGYNRSVVHIVNDHFQAQYDRREKYGLFKLDNIPTNLYYNFLKFPDPIFDPATNHLVFPYLRATNEGLSFLITSPIFLLILLKKSKDSTHRNLMISSIVLFIVLLMYVNWGESQYGSRYLLDVIPLWFVLLLYALRAKLSSLMCALIIVSGFVNIYFFISMSFPIG